MNPKKGMGWSQHTLLSDNGVCTLQASPLWVLKGLNVSRAGAFSCSSWRRIVELGCRIGAARWIMLQFLVWCFRIKPFAAYLRTHQKSCPSCEPLMGKECIHVVEGGCGWVGFKKFVFQNEPFTIPGSGRIIYTSHVWNRCDSARYNVACLHVSCGGWE